MDGYGMRRLVLMMMMITLMMPISSSLHRHPPSPPSDAIYSKPLCYLNCVRRYLNLLRVGIYGRTVRLCVRFICNHE
jgi:hypothetical protein